MTPSHRRTRAGAGGAWGGEGASPGAPAAPGTSCPRPPRHRRSTLAPVGLRAALALAALLLAPGSARAQLGGSNLLEAQIGNYPRSYVDRGPTNRIDAYDQANLEYLFRSGLLGLRFETHRNSLDQYAYEKITQRYLDLSDGRYRLRVGNFYTILGRGLVHRSFELNGVVLDQRFPRSRYGPSRDVDGVLGEARLGPVSVIALGGTPSGGETSPAGEPFGFRRYAGQIGGGEIAATVYRNARIGAAYLRATAGLGQQEVASGFVDLDPLRLLGVKRAALPIYVEYAQTDRPFADWWGFRVADRVPHALYAGANLLWGPVGVSAEWKDYSQFRLGINDPPSLIREHAFNLLNRSTHVLNAAREEGFQLEGVWTPLSGTSLTANWSRADGANARRFDERYLEVRYTPPAGVWEATAFYDRNRDDVVSISDRRTYGGAGTVHVTALWSAAADLERQTATRETGAEPQRYEDVYVTGTVARANVGSASVIWARTTDPLDLSRVDPGTEPLHLVGGVLNARLSPAHEAILFFGRRRGGLACTAGTCYEVQAFEGVELRLLSRF